MKVTSKINYSHSKAMQSVFRKSQIKTCDAIKSDLQDSQTLPFDTGALQQNIFVDDSKVKKGIVIIAHSNLPYPRRLYFHPEYNYKRDKNTKAGGMWYEPYINGNKKKMPYIYFARFVRKEMENVINKH